MAEESTEAVEETTAPSEEMVKITDATEDDLNAFLDDNEYREGENVEESVEEESQPVDPSEQQKQEEVTPEVDVAAEQEKMQQNLERFRKQVEGQEILMQRQISKIAELKRQLIGMNQELLQNIGDKQLEDPRSAELDRMRLNQNQQQINALENEERMLAQRSNFMQAVTRYIPPTEMPQIDELCECLKADGLDDSQLVEFRKDPSRMPVSTFIQLQRRARAEKAFSKMIPTLKQLVEENKNLKAALKNGRRNVLNGVEKAARQTPSVTSARPSSTDVPSFIDVTKLSDAELEELLRKGQAY